MYKQNSNYGTSIKEMPKMYTKMFTFGSQGSIKSIYTKSDFIITIQIQSIHQSEARL